MIVFLYAAISITGFWLWLEFEDATLRILGLLLIVLGLYIYRRKHG